ncbi:membrane alanyl aminopeptidase-like [Manduca sexta]|uniref:membrane alanyl aminopeptidase-like n=1 Tax=Manduca sexta TaxID=7130 RepID=UPI00188DED3F|nr:membrane alanyl aminopeptidase-like [Manduca sexta]XP_037296701.1 membrane alanyl aminopeptidase-like [Manduca sexta]
MYIILLAALCAHAVHADENYRLNTPVVPSAYEITITPYFDTGDDNAFTFDGEVAITLKTTAPTRVIKLHSEDLIYSADNVTVSRNGVQLPLDQTNPLNFNTNYTFAFINLQNELEANDNYILRILYRGPIRSDLNGFYRNDYIENGVKKWLGATQMEPTHARKAFPCFDEPGLKAVFTLNIDRPQHYEPSLTNTKIQNTTNMSNGYVRERFYPTPIMSTYLVAFMVSEFKAARANSDKSFGIYTRPEAVNQSQYAYDFGIKVVDALSNYFGIGYYSTNSNLKLDHVALPDFRAGAMENWGLVKYREALILYNEGESTPYYKYRVAQIIAHETTHMWFGNLVTCHWWSNTWLNEGFANYFQDYITIYVDPDVASDNQLVIGSVYSAYDADSSPNSAPITNVNVNSPAEISGHFGTITYQKAGSVIRMMHHLMGDDAFKRGLNVYLNNNRFGSGYPRLMYSALEEGVAHANQAMSAYPNLNVTDIMASWISQPGHPLLTVNINYNTRVASLHQKRYYANSSISSEEVYMIPISYTTENSANFNDTKPAFIMSGRTHEVNIENLIDSNWVIFNVQETGLYRVNYDDHSWQIITEALKSSRRESIHYLNRAKIVNDLFALFYADEVEFIRLNQTLQFLKNEDSYSVWYAAIRGFNRLRNSFLGDSLLKYIDRTALGLVENIINKLGYEERASDDFETLRNRMQILEFACKIGHQGCIDNTVALFRNFKNNGVSISPSLRPVAYCSGLRFGNGLDYEFLWRRMSTTNIANEARLIGEALGCSTDEPSLRKYLLSMREENSPIKIQDLTVPLTGVLSNYSHLHIVMDELQHNYTLWSTIYPSMDSIVSTVASALHTSYDFIDFADWLQSCQECSNQTKMAGMNAMAQAQAARSWASEHRQMILDVLKSFSTTLAPSLMMIVTGVAVYLNRLLM